MAGTVEPPGARLNRNAPPRVGHRSGLLLLRRCRPGPRIAAVFDTALPYRVFDADNHFYEPPGILEPYLEARFHDRVAVDYTPDKAAQHNAKIRAELEQRKKEGGVIPGMALNKMNPLRDK